MRRPVHAAFAVVLPKKQSCRHFDQILVAVSWIRRLITPRRGDAPLLPVHCLSVRLNAQDLLLRPRVDPEKLSVHSRARVAGVVNNVAA